MATVVPVLSGHSKPILDVNFSPFHDNLLVTASEDCSIKLWEIPRGGLKKDKSDYLQEFDGHGNKVIMTKWHPSAENCLASASADGSVKIWDVSGRHDEIFSLSVNDSAYDL